MTARQPRAALAGAFTDRFPLLGVVLSRTFPHVVLESNYRHRAPIERFLILASASAVVGLILAARKQSVIDEATWR